MHNRIRGLAFAVFACLVMLFAACTPSQQAISPQDPFTWSIAHQVQSPDGKAVAVLETGISNMSTRTAPLHRVSIQTAGVAKKWGNNWTVWQSQVSHAPTLSWRSDSHLVIEQEPYEVLEYEPEVTIADRVYAIDISVVRGGP